MPRFNKKKADTGVPVTIDRDRYTEGDSSTILEGGVALGEQESNVCLPIQFDANGYIKLYFDGNPLFQTEYLDGAVNTDSKGTLILGDDGANLQNISVGANGRLQVEVVEGDYNDVKYQDNAVVASPFGYVAMGHDESNVFPVKVDSNGYLQISCIKASFLNSIADVTLVALETTQIVEGLASRLSILINNKRTNMQTFRIGDSDVGVTRGVELAPGESISIETTEAIYGYNPGSSNEAVSVVLREENDNPEPPAAPVLISPTDGSMVANTSITFQWNSSSGATNYQIRVSTDPNVENPLFHDNLTSGATSKNYTDFPNDGTTYYWKVRAYSTIGWGDWSTIWYFVNGEVPEPPVLISPIDGSMVANTSITFQWNSSSGATNYHIKISTDPGAETNLFHESWTSATSKNYTNFPNDGTVYYWKVRAYNAAGWGSWSTIWSFTNGELSAAPILISPTNGSKVSNISITFQWNVSSGATNYQIRVSVDPNVEDPLFHDDTTGGATSKNYTNFPNDGTVYYWKVRAYNAAGWGSWSTIWSFTNGDDDVPLIESGHSDYYDLNSKEVKYFKFIAAATESYPIIVINTPGSGGPYTTHILIKRGSKATIAEFEITWPLSPSLSGIPPYEDLYWYYSTGSAGEMVKVKNPSDLKTYYIMMYNDGEEAIYNQHLSLSYYEF